MPQGKAYQQYLENTKNKAELTDQFTIHPSRPHSLKTERKRYI